MWSDKVKAAGQIVKVQALSRAWMEAKRREQQAIDTRREVEDKLVELLGVDPSDEGTDTHEIGEYQIKIVGRLTRKVDSDLVQEIAAEHHLTEHLPQLFRWKPEINMTAWKRADEKITRPLLGAITTTPGRPSFTIIQKD